MKRKLTKRVDGQNSVMCDPLQGKVKIELFKYRCNGIPYKIATAMPIYCGFQYVSAFLKVMSRDLTFHDGRTAHSVGLPPF